MKIERDRKTGEVSVSQPAYINELTQDIPDVDLPRAPATRDILNNKNPGNPIDRIEFLRRVMKLMFAATFW